MKHKVFFWLLLKDRLSTRDLLQRKNMDLDCYSCELCLRQRPETVLHLFLRCSFAKACWNSIGVSVVTSRPLPQIIKQIKHKLQVPFFMDVIILMTWSIWLTRNDWMFNGIHPKRKFMTEFSLVLLRARVESVPAMSAWLSSL